MVTKMFSSMGKIGQATLLAGAVSLFGGCVNHPPVIKSIPYQTFPEGQQLGLDLSPYIGDPEGDLVTVELVGGPGNISNNRFSYQDQPDNDHACNFYNIKFRAVDIHGGETKGSFGITQQDINHPPIIQTIPDQVMKEDEGFLPVDIGQYISDPDGDEISVNFASGPAGGFHGTTFSLWTGGLADSDLIDNEYMIEFLARDGYGGEARGSFKLTKQDITTPSTVTDLSGQQYLFSRGQSDFLDIPCSFYMTSAAIESNGITYLCNFKKIQKIDRLENGQVNVFLRSGEIITGSWVPNNNVTNFYRDENNSFKSGSFFGISDGKEVELKIDDIKEAVFEGPEQPVPNKTSSNRKYPKRIELNNGPAIETGNGYIIDFCGHDWRSSHHTELDNYYLSLCHKSVPLKEVAEVELTGDFNREDDKAQCREIVLKYKDGSEEKGHLLLYSESHYGHCYSWQRFREFDVMFAEQDYGAMLIPLNHVRKIVPIGGESK
ncbi:MAG TPA: hypothetical protein VJA47_00685 [archaeon]|nr:hypothetical protein [archaeon]